MKKVNGKLTLFFNGKLTFEDSKTKKIHEIIDETFCVTYRMLPATSWVGGAVRQTSENASLECEILENNSIRKIHVANISIEPADNFRFTHVEISSADEKLTISYIRNKNDLA